VPGPIRAEVSAERLATEAESCKWNTSDGMNNGAQLSAGRPLDGLGADGPQ